MAVDGAERFRDFVIVSLQGKAIVLENDERALVADGIARFDLDITGARGTVRAVAHQNDVILASETARHMRDVLQGLAGRKGRVTRGEFRRGVKILRASTRGALDEKQARSWLKHVVIENDFRIARGGMTFSRRWFNRIPQTVKT